MNIMNLIRYGCVSMIVSSWILLSGCVVKEEIFLQNVDVEGSVLQPPVHIVDASTEKRTFHVSPHILVNTQRSLTTSLDRQYRGQIPDTLEDFNRTGLQWNLPSMKLGFDLDYAISDNVALTGGFATSFTRGRQLLGGYGGLGLYSVDTSMSFRLDVGIQYNQMSYRSATVLARSTTFGGSSANDTVHFHDRGYDSNVNFFVSMTFNTANPAQRINYFLQLGVSPQTLTSFTPEESVYYGTGITYALSDQRAESSVLLLSATPGVYFTVGQLHSVVLGMRVLKEVLSESSRPGVLLIPMVQFDWNL